jgi:hypothetical protein
MSAARDEYLEEMAEDTERGYRLEDVDDELELELEVVSLDVAIERLTAALAAGGMNPVLTGRPRWRK